MAGSAADAEQEQKRAAAAAYDYEGDARWAEYWSNVLVPPNLASRPDVVDHLKRKFYQRYIVSSTSTAWSAVTPPARSG
jgi:transmembrane protein 33